MRCRWWSRLAAHSTSERGGEQPLLALGGGSGLTGSCLELGLACGDHPIMHPSLHSTPTPASYCSAAPLCAKGAIAGSKENV